MSGRSVKNRPELEKAIDQLGTGDKLVVAEWDRATRSIMDGVANIDRIHRRGCLLKVLDKPHGSHHAASFIAFLPPWPRTSASAPWPLQGHDAAAKARGIKLGRKPKLIDHQRQEARRRLESGESARPIAKILGVHHATVLVAC